MNTDNGLLIDYAFQEQLEDKAQLAQFRDYVMAKVVSEAAAIAEKDPFAAVRIENHWCPSLNPQVVQHARTTLSQAPADWQRLV